MKKSHAYLPGTKAAVEALGAEIATARRELGWTAAELADRLGVTPGVVSRIENGAPSTTIGTVFEAAVVCGLPLFEADSASGLRDVADRAQLRLALLPRRVRGVTTEISDDF